ncbi:methionyl-tRNA formyltransferase [Paradesertivirga mongoliensis]|uniref:Methionyl-tRNA formyltransferase n=1 Tax=Paradesertivirga mongoliensis TaxID=2100740 RepID=A0ABW4ZLW4_9SPHI|nr:methionyl-tRNA formyltransferase [Pedobacter mongoliensis]
MRIIFMGTPEFAVASLEALLNAGCNIVGVVTAPDKPAGRGQKIHESAVKQFALSKGLEVLQPLKLKDPDFHDKLRSLKADLQVVVAFRMLPETVWDMPPKGTINLHASLLPKYRGAAPINWAVINGEKETGVTTFLLQHEIDTGNILFSKSVPISEQETAGDIHDKLMQTGATLLVDTVKAIESGDYTPVVQPEILPGETELPHAPKIFKEDCLIRWNQPVEKVYNHIRGLSPYPTAYTVFKEKTLKIYSAEIMDKEPGIQPGGFLSDDKSYLRFACLDGFICVRDIQMEGKKRMPVEEFLRGFRN